MINKPYQKIPIKDCGESLVEIPPDMFPLELPHPYQKLGADYQGRSPYYLRESVLNALINAQLNLQDIYGGWCIKIFDAYRPLEVQSFMVDYTFNSILRSKQLKLEQLSTQQIEDVWQQVYQFWAIPSHNPLTPPPHSTGAAIDITLVNKQGETIDMGGAIDEISERSQPNYYAQFNDSKAKKYHEYRELLNQIMTNNGFVRHPQEWWHFSLGDQMWAWYYNQQNPDNLFIARYGRIENN